MQGKNNKRMENLLNVLLVDLRTFFASRLYEKESGRRFNWKRLETIVEREKAAAALCIVPGAIQIVDADAGEVLVKSGSRPGLFHEVSLAHARCSCPDTTGLLCKHIRAAAR